MSVNAQHADVSPKERWVKQYSFPYTFTARFDQADNSISTW